MPNPTQTELRQILTDAKTIAMVGASNTPSKPSSGIFKFLKEKGYRMIPVNPNESEVHGEPTVASLLDIKEPVDIVNVFRRPEATPEIAQQAAQIQAKVLWLQLGIANEEAAQIAKDAGLSVVMDLCIWPTHVQLMQPT